MTTPDDESWIDRERRIAAEKEIERQAERQKAEKDFDARLQRMRADGMDDGTGKCIVCAIAFTLDDEQRAMHAANDCPGRKPADCSQCGASYRVKRSDVPGCTTWEPSCGPADHIKKTATAEPERYELPPIRRSPRFGGDGDDD